MRFARNGHRAVAGDRGLRGVAKNRLKRLCWTGAEAQVATYVVWHRDKWISPTLRAFIEVLKIEMCGSAIEHRAEPNRVYSARRRRTARISASTSRHTPR